MSARALAESWDAYLVDSVPVDATEAHIVALRRCFFAGALATLGLPPEQLRAELLAHGRSVGTAAERARA